MKKKSLILKPSAGGLEMGFTGSLDKGNVDQALYGLPFSQNIQSPHIYIISSGGKTTGDAQGVRGGASHHRFRDEHVHVC